MGFKSELTLEISRQPEARQEQGRAEHAASKNRLHCWTVNLQIRVSDSTKIDMRSGKNQLVFCRGAVDTKNVSYQRRYIRYQVSRQANGRFKLQLQMRSTVQVAVDSCLLFAFVCFQAFQF